MPDNNAEEIMNEYEKELEKFFKGKSDKSFDEITNEMLDKMKKEGKKVAENKQKETDDNSKKK